MLLETKQDVPDFLQQYIPEGYQEGNDLRFEVDSDEGDNNAAASGGFGGNGGGDSSGAGWDSSAPPKPTPAAATAAWNAFGDSQPESKSPVPEAKVAPNTVKAVPPVAASATVGGWGTSQSVAPAAASVPKAAPAISAAKVTPVTKAAPVAAASASGWGVSDDDGWGTGGGESSW